jgi:DNA-binding transcriptional ArsR family regulator
MRELRLMKLVTAEKRGRMVYYRLTDTHIRHIFEDTLRHVQEDAHGSEGAGTA